MDSLIVEINVGSRGAIAAATKESFDLSNTLSQRTHLFDPKPLHRIQTQCEEKSETPEDSEQKAEATNDVESDEKDAEIVTNKLFEVHSILRSPKDESQFWVTVSGAGVHPGSMFLCAFDAPQTIEQILTRTSEKYRAGNLCASKSGKFFRLRSSLETYASVLQTNHHAT